MFGRTSVRTCFVVFLVKLLSTWSSTLRRRSSEIESLCMMEGRISTLPCLYPLEETKYALLKSVYTRVLNQKPLLLKYVILLLCTFSKCYIVIFLYLMECHGVLTSQTALLGGAGGHNSRGGKRQEL